MVERDLAKVEVAGSSPVFRSKKLPPEREFFFGFSFFLTQENKRCPGGEIGRHAGLKIPLAAMPVTVQFRSGAQKNSSDHLIAFFILKNNENKKPPLRKGRFAFEALLKYNSRLVALLFYNFFYLYFLILIYNLQQVNSRSIILNINTTSRYKVRHCLQQFSFV